ncbi:MAG: condensation domain-containing protein, partial [Myxococcota bacterium]
QHRLILLSTHHALCDGWSIGVIVSELGKLYTADIEGTSCQLPEVVQFREYVAARELMHDAPEMMEHARYWQDKFGALPPQLDLPTDRLRPPVKTYRAHRLAHRLDADLCRELHRVARAQNSSFFMLNLAAYLLLMHRISDQDELVVGIPVAGQIAEMGRALVGHCANLLPIHSELAGCERFSDFLRRTKEVLIDAFDHRDYSIHRLVTMLPIPRDASRNPLVSAVFNLDHGAPPEMAGLQSNYWHGQPIEFALSETSLNAVEVDSELLLDWNYNQDLFDVETVECWHACYKALLETVVATPDCRLADMSIAPPAEQRQILHSWNDTRASFQDDVCLHQLFDLQVAKTPQALAVTCAD